MNNERQPLAIVGMACRFPEVDSIAELLQALKQGVNAIDTVPADRWDANRYFSSNEVSKGKAYVRRGGFLKQNIQEFDAAFFGISPREAENMDPQQRLILEVVWEAFENAGFRLPDFSGANIGVYVGGFMLDHMITQMAFANRSMINQHSAAGMMMTMLSNRVSHTFNFVGPSMSIDTACSSSLVSFHVACQDVWRGACEMAIVGGTNVMMRPEYPMGMCKGHFLSRDGESKSFDRRGDGYGRGEGAGAVLVKPYDQALQDGDCILAKVLGTGTNQDGRTPGISMPNGNSQRSLIESVCKQNGIQFGEVEYVECHGTGTGIGDPTECTAIGNTYGKNRSDNPVVVGSIKSNIGHLEAAAGVAGIIKAVLTLQERRAFPLGNFQQQNEEIDFSGLGIRLSTESIPLGTGKEPITVAVNSFGYGGSNAHVVLESASVVKKSNVARASEDFESPGFLLPITAKSSGALKSNAKQLAEFLKNSNSDIEDIVYTAIKHRVHLPHRAVVSGPTRGGLASALESFASDSENPNLVVDSQPFQGLRSAVFVFTGMGPQWWYMGQQLYKSEPLYRDLVEQADSIFKTISGFSILKEMLKPEAESRIQKTIYAQPANLFIQIGIYELLKKYGVNPGVVVGHSVGELASAYAAGILTLTDALKVSFHRSQLQAETAGTGGMLAVGLGKQDVLNRFSLDNGVSLAAINSTSTVTLAGDISVLANISDELTSSETFSRMLDVEIPYHSPMMDPLMGRLESALSDVAPAIPKLPIFSTVTGEQVSGVSFGAEYWPKNIRQPVEFEAAIMNILELGYTTFVEIGPHPVLASSLRDCAAAAGKDCRLIHTLRRNLPDESQSVLRAAMNVFAAGCEINWDAHCPQGSFVVLPNYAWQRETYWNENDRAAQDRLNPIVSPILGTQEALAAPVWRNDFDHEPVAYLRDHVVSGIPILPAAAYLEALFELAAIQYPEANGFAVRNVDIKRPAIITPERGLDFTTTFDPTTRNVVQRSLDNGKLGTGVEHLSARISGISHCSPDSLDTDGRTSENAADAADIAAFYRGLKQVGLSYGKQFQTLKQLLKLGDEKILARLELSDELKLDCDKYHLHPTLLDGCFQSLMSMLNTADAMFLPTNIDEICLYRTEPGPLESIWCSGEMVEKSIRAIKCDLTIQGANGELICSIRGLTATAAAKSEQRTDKFGDPVKLQILNYHWDYGETLSEPSRLGHWLLVGQPPDPAKFIGSQLENFGATICGDVSFGSEFRQEKNQFTLNHDSLEDAKEVVKSVGQLDGIVFYVALDQQLIEDCPTGQKALEALITFTKALLEIPVAQRPRVYVVTNCCFEIEGEPWKPDPLSAAVNGWVRVARNELPGFNFSTIDMSNCEDENELFWVTMELVSDSPHDEVAIRGELRFISELQESKLLSEDQVQHAGLSDETPVLVRPVNEDSDSVGTVRLIADSKKKAPSDEIVIRIDKSAVPINLLKNQASLDIDQPLVEFVGEIIDVGADIHDLAVGDNVCGLAPSEISSQLSGKRDHFFLTPVPDKIDRANLLANIGILSIIHYACDQHKNLKGKRAIVSNSRHTDLLVTHLAQKGVHVTILLDPNADVSEGFCEGHEFCPPCPESLASLVQSDGKFDLLVANLAAWSDEFGFSCLSQNAGIVDTSDHAEPVLLPANVRSVSRMDLHCAITEPKELAAAVTSAAQVISTEKRYPRVAFEVSIADLSWRKLPLNDTDSFLVVDYDIGTKDLPVVRVDDLRFRRDATYLISGGLGGFGKKTGLWLAEHGAGCVALIGRKGIKTDEDRTFVEQLTKAGVDVRVFACDVGNQRQVDELFVEIADTLPPLKGIFHSAAVIEDQPIAETELRTFKTVMDAKAVGAWNLHCASLDMELDHFVLYSSLSNQIGNSRQGAYSAANGFLNGLARLRRSMELPAISVNWGAISDVGIIAEDEKLEAFLRQVGLRGLSSREGLEILRKALARNVNQFGVVVIKSWADWARYETEGSKSPRFATVIAADSDDTSNEARKQLLAELVMLTPAAQTDLMSNLTAQIVGTVLKSEPDSLEINRPINELGIDSLMATEIQILFEKKLGLSIAVLELLGDTTIRSMAMNLVAKLSDEMLRFGQDEVKQAPPIADPSIRLPASILSGS